MTEIVADLKLKAARIAFDGSQLTAHVLDKCRYYDEGRGVLLLFTRDVGHHACGWWKNPEYERCFHLSLSFKDVESSEAAPHNKKLALEWLKLFFGQDRDKLWCEPPYTAVGKKLAVWHYRLFCNPAWEPIKPRGEVYTREFTEAGWKSYSELKYEKAKHATALR